MVMVDEATRYSVVLPFRQERILANPERIRSEDIKEAFDLFDEVLRGILITPFDGRSDLSVIR